MRQSSSSSSRPPVVWAAFLAAALLLPCLLVPVALAATSIGVGSVFSCVSLAAGTVRCAGTGNDGELGYSNGLTNVGLALATPTYAAGDLPLFYGGNTSDPLWVKVVVASGAAACALDTAHNGGDVYCWGLGTSGTLGRGNKLSIGLTDSPTAPGPLPLGGAAADVCIGDGHACVLRADGKVVCWGSSVGNGLGLGVGDTYGTEAGEPLSAAVVNVTASPTETVRQLACGFSNTYAVLSNGSLVGWGKGGSGQLGLPGNFDNVGVDDVPADRPPLVMPGGAAVRQVCSGQDFACAVLDTAAAPVVCWGTNSVGQLGIGGTASINDSSLAATAAVGGPAAQVSCGLTHACALLVNGSLVCWGSNEAGQLGYGPAAPALAGLSAAQVLAAVGYLPLAGGALADAVFASSQSCALLRGGANLMQCWGSNERAQLMINRQRLYNVGRDIPASAGPLVTVTCGDGVVQASEQELCDDANTVAGDGCSEDCRYVEPLWNCLVPGQPCDGICGDGVVIGTEECDSGESDAGSNGTAAMAGAAASNGCSSRCRVEAGFKCPNNGTACYSICGDALRALDELCDDGNTDDNDGCNAACRPERGWSLTQTSSGKTVCETVCGDGLRRGTEECDDNNQRNGDGCNRICRVENNYRCHGQPSKCTRSGLDSGEVVGLVIGVAAAALLCCFCCAALLAAAIAAAVVYGRRITKRRGFYFWSESVYLQRVHIHFDRPLGDGRFGSVFEATWQGTEVAAKRITATGADATAALQAEAAVFRSLVHPNIVQFLGLFRLENAAAIEAAATGAIVLGAVVGIDDNSVSSVSGSSGDDDSAGGGGGGGNGDGGDIGGNELHESGQYQEFIVSELVRGGNLAQMVQQRRLRMLEIVQIGRCVAAGMVQLEAKRVVHRDLAARNVLVLETQQGIIAKVTDFGLATRIEEGQWSQPVRGPYPVRWTPPEGMCGEVNPRTDVWSFAVLLWEIIEGRDVPYDELHGAQAIYDYLQDGRRLVCHRRLPARLRRLLLNCWDFDPLERPTFDHVANELAAIELLLQQSDRDFDDDDAATSVATGDGRHNHHQHRVAAVAGDQDASGSDRDLADIDAEAGVEQPVSRTTSGGATTTASPTTVTATNVGSGGGSGGGGGGGTAAASRRPPLGTPAQYEVNFGSMYSTQYLSRLVEPRGVAKKPAANAVGGGSSSGSSSGSDSESGGAE